MTTEPILHPITKEGLLRSAANPPHALLLTGPVGIGKTTLANWLAVQILEIRQEKLETYPHLLRITPEGTKAIGIEAVRQLEHFISLKTPAKRAINRLVIVYDAHKLTVEAQNALLKTLEEPPSDTVIILTSSRQEALLPTIRSRMQAIDIITPPRDSLESHLKGLPADKRAQIIAISGGLPGLAIALSEDDQEHPLVQSAKTARQLLQVSTFERLAQVDVLSKDREQTSNVLFILMQMAHAALLTGRGGERWQKVLTASYDAQLSIDGGTQPKLALTSLMLNL